ncbi:MAG: hypothetical protein CFE21_06240 [Bacteroidetes bacterium B1(2017)]|nr:MAG: hypothetical protein CFE21_06240 [Bacteroidetes bacterium B1(2017)]
MKPIFKELRLFSVKSLCAKFLVSFLWLFLSNNLSAQKKLSGEYELPNGSVHFSFKNNFGYSCYYGSCTTLRIDSGTYSFNKDTLIFKSAIHPDSLQPVFISDQIPNSSNTTINLDTFYLTINNNLFAKTPFKLRLYFEDSLLLYLDSMNRKEALFYAIPNFSKSIDSKFMVFINNQHKEFLQQKLIEIDIRRPWVTYEPFHYPMMYRRKKLYLFFDNYGVQQRIYLKKVAGRR